MSASELLYKVMHITGIKSPERAMAVTRAVFDSLRDMISQDTSNHIAEQVPGDLWPLGPVESVSQLIPTFESFDMHGFLSRVQKEAGLEDSGQAEQMSRAVLSVLRENLDAHTSTLIANDLPGDVRILWTGATAYVPPEQAQDVTAASEVQPRNLEPSIPRKWPPDVLAAERYQAEKQLAEEIEGLLDVSDDVDASSVNVQVTHGEVILRGTVKTEREREAAQRVVNDALESTSVRNEIHVEG